MANPEVLNSSLTRRNLLRVGVGLGLGVAAGVGNARNLEAPQQPLVVEIKNPQVELTLTDEVFGEEEAIRQVNGKIESGKPVTPEYPLFRSLLYHSMRFYGIGHEAALKNSKAIVIERPANISCQEQAIACSVYDGANFKTQIKDYSITNSDWYNAIRIIDHEAFHGACEDIPREESVENYGVLGRVAMQGIRSGFLAAGMYSNRIGNLMFDKTHDGLEYSVPEEFFAEAGRIRRFKDLVRKGLVVSNRVNDRYLNRPAAYEDLFKGISQYIQAFDGNNDLMSVVLNDMAVNPRAVDLLHSQSLRLLFFGSLGRRIMDINRGINISPDNVSALGLVSFADLALYNRTRNAVIKNLLSSRKINNASLEEAADVLVNAKSS